MCQTRRAMHHSLHPKWREREALLSLGTTSSQFHEQQCAPLREVLAPLLDHDSL